MQFSELKSAHPGLIWVTKNGWAAVQKKLERMERRAIKLGRPMPSITIEAEGVVDTDLKHDGLVWRTVKVPYVGIKVVGQPVVLNGWQFVAVIQHTSEGNILHRPFGNGDEDITIPKRYRSTTTKLCEHCNTKRKRNDTYLVLKMSEGIWKQVGKTCLRDHCGGHDPVNALFAADAPRRIQGWIDDELKREKFIPTVEVRQFTADVVTIARTSGGLVTAKMARESGEKTTAANVWSCHVGTDIVAAVGWKFIRQEQTEADVAKADAALAWAQGINERTDNEYLSNLRAACTLEEIPARNMNLVASIIPAHDYQLRQEAEAIAAKQAGAEAPVNDFTKGQRYDFGRVRFVAANGFETRYGRKFFLKFIDEKGRRITWCTHKPLSELKFGSELRLDGKFVQTKAYRGVTEVQINYCRYRPIEEEVVVAKESLLW